VALSSAATGLGATEALAAPPSVTLSGTGLDGSPSSSDDKTDFASVNATLSQGVATGTLETAGKKGDVYGTWYVFEGNVTCMVVHGTHVKVGAFGTVWRGPSREPGAPREQLPGTYAQVLSVEFGEFSRAEEFQNPPPPLTDTFGMVGENNRGLPSSTPPSCTALGSFKNQHRPSSGGAIAISPSITSPKDGYRSKTGSVKFSGTAEPNTAIKVYEEGGEGRSADVTADANGKWTVTLNGLGVGAHTFSAISLAPTGSTVPANTVLVEVG
jgi:hypothetical protein